MTPKRSAMKKLLWPLCVVVVLLSAAGLGFALAYLTEELTYDQIAGYEAKVPAVHVDHGAGTPADAYRSIGILHEGDYPGLSDVPVTAKQAAPGRAALNALRRQKYTRLLPFVRPAKGGVALRETSGCSSWCIAYWDGKHLWLPGEEEGQWRGCRPSNPDKLDETLKSIHNK